MYTNLLITICMCTIVNTLYVILTYYTSRVYTGGHCTHIAYSLLAALLDYQY